MENQEAIRNFTDGALLEPDSVYNSDPIDTSKIEAGKLSIKYGHYQILLFQQLDGCGMHGEVLLGGYESAADAQQDMTTLKTESPLADIRLYDAVEGTRLR